MTDQQAGQGRGAGSAGTRPGGARRAALLKALSWRRAAPFLVAGVIMAWLFFHLDLCAFLAALRSADVFVYVPWLLGFILVTFLMDAQNLAAVLGEFGHPIGFRSALGMRGGTYLLMTIDHTLGLGALVYCLRRELAVPVMRMAGIMLFFNTVTQVSLVILASAGLLLVGPSAPLLRYFLVTCLGFSGAVLLFVAAVKRLPAAGFGAAFRRMSLVRVFHEVSLKGCCLLVFWRCIYYAPFIVFFFVAARAFHMEIPFVVLVAYVPIILLVVSMPVTPGGLGTAQAAMLYLLGAYGSRENIMAFGLTYSVSVLLLRGLIGIMFMSRLSGEAAGKPSG